MNNTVERILRGKRCSVWVSVKELFKVLKEMDMWTIDTKYLNIYLDTRLIDGDYHCTIKDRNNGRYLSLEDLKTIREKVQIK